MAMVEDLSVFFGTAEFAVDATLQYNAGGDPLAGTVIFDVNGGIVEEFVETQSPAAVCAAEQWPDAVDGDVLTIGATAYRLRDVRLLNDGAIKLLVLARV